MSTRSVDSNYSNGKESSTTLSSIQGDLKFQLVVKTPKLSPFNSLFFDSFNRIYDVNPYVQNSKLKIRDTQSLFRQNLEPLAELVEEEYEDDSRPLRIRHERFRLMEDRNEFGERAGKRTRSLEARTK